VFKNLKYGMTENDVLIEVEHQMLKHGTEGSSFVTGIMIKGPGIDDMIEGVSRAGQVEIQAGRSWPLTLGWCWTATSTTLAAPSTAVSLTPNCAASTSW